MGLAYSSTALLCYGRDLGICLELRVKSAAPRPAGMTSDSFLSLDCSTFVALFFEFESRICISRLMIVLLALQLVLHNICAPNDIGGRWVDVALLPGAWLASSCLPLLLVSQWYIRTALFLGEFDYFQDQAIRQEYYSCCVASSVQSRLQHLWTRKVQ